MEKLFDIDELHAGYRRKKIRKVILSCLVITLLIFGWVSASGRSTHSTSAPNLTNSNQNTPILANDPENSLTEPNSTSLSNTPLNTSGSSTIPSSSIKFPTYTVPDMPSSTVPSTGSTFTAHDPVKCAQAHAQISQIDASYANEDQQLQQDIQNFNNYLTNNSRTYVARGYGPSPAEQAADNRTSAQLQTEQSQLYANVSAKNNAEAPYQQQVSATCS